MAHEIWFWMKLSHFPIWCLGMDFSMSFQLFQRVASNYATTKVFVYHVERSAAWTKW